MSFWTDLRLPTEHELLVGVYDCHWLAQHVDKAAGPLDVLSTLAGYFAATATIVKAAGGRLIKTMGDTGLAVFPAELVDDGVHAFQTLQEVGESWLGERGFRSRVTVKMDAGPAVLGMTGSPGDEIMDVFGKCVATAFTVPSSGIAMTPAVFRRLSPNSRKPFRKHTPPVRYIGSEDVRLRDRLQA